MSKRPWYKRYGGDFVLGTMSLTLEEKGAYSLCLDLIYDRGAPIPDDGRWLAGICGVSVRKWTALRSRLIELGKLIAKDGFLTNARADRELAEATAYAQTASERGSRGAQKRVENASKVNRKPAEIEDDTNDFNEVGQAIQKPEARCQRENETSPLNSHLHQRGFNLFSFCEANVKREAASTP